jgi:hypothetical protein
MGRSAADLLGNAGVGEGIPYSPMRANKSARHNWRPTAGTAHSEDDQAGYFLLNSCWAARGTTTPGRCRKKESSNE